MTDDPFVVGTVLVLEQQLAQLRAAARTILVVLDGGPRIYEAADLDAAADDLRRALNPE